VTNDQAENRAAEIALEARALSGARLFSPSAARNRGPIAETMQALLPKEGLFLEIGAGTGEHCVHAAPLFPGVTWHPGDPDPASRDSIAGWVADSGLSTIRAPHAIDVTRADWFAAYDANVSALISINMIHIAPFAAAEGLFAGAGALLDETGLVYLYGPFSRDGVHTAASNADFDASLKARDPRWGVRDLDREIVPLAHANGLIPDHVVDMPANNLSVTFRRA